MPRRSKVEKLPAEVKAWLDRALAENGFSEYNALAAELKKRGFAISKSALHEYGSQFEERLKTLKIVSEQARAVVQASPDEEDAVTQALVRLTQEKLFGVLMALQVDPAEINLSSITRSIAELARSSVQTKKWAAEWKDKAQAKLRELEGRADAENLDVATLQRAAKELYGLA